MTVEIADEVEEQLRDLAMREGKGIDRLVEDAIQQYLVSVSITDVSPEEVGETQMALAGELHADLTGWSDEDPG